LSYLELKRKMAQSLNEVILAIYLTRATSGPSSA
jgi:hypothetical protein